MRGGKLPIGDTITQAVVNDEWPRRPYVPIDIPAEIAPQTAVRIVRVHIGRNHGEPVHQPWSQVNMVPGCPVAGPLPALKHHTAGVVLVTSARSFNVEIMEDRVSEDIIHVRDLPV